MLQDLNKILQDSNKMLQDSNKILQDLRTKCYKIRTKCYKTWTKCYKIRNKCYKIQTKCYKTWTKCYKIRTKCYKIRTKCYKIRTKCYKIYLFLNFFSISTETFLNHKTNAVKHQNYKLILRILNCAGYLVNRWVIQGLMSHKHKIGAYKTNRLQYTFNSTACSDNTLQNLLYLKSAGLIYLQPLCFYFL